MWQKGKPIEGIGLAMETEDTECFQWNDSAMRSFLSIPTIAQLLLLQRGIDDLLLHFLL